MQGEFFGVSAREGADCGHGDDSTDGGGAGADQNLFRERPAGLVADGEAATVEEFGFEGREEGIGYGVVVGVLSVPLTFDAGLFASGLEMTGDVGWPPRPEWWITWVVSDCPIAMSRARANVNVLQ